MIHRDALPLTPTRLVEVRRRADAVRHAVDAALPSRSGARKTKLVADFAPLTAAFDVLSALEPDAAARIPLRRACVALGVAHHRFTAREKRAALAEAVTELILLGPSDAVARTHARTLEVAALAPIGGLLRWCDREAA